MARSLVCLAGRGRVASALGVGLLVGSLALVGCSSGSPKGGGTIPPVNTAGASGGSSVSVSASAGATSAASAGAVTAESLSDSTLGYTVVSIPKDLDATQTKVLQDFVAYDKATWRVWSTGEGYDDALNRTTGAAQGMLQDGYDAMTDHSDPPIMVGVGNVEVSKDTNSADVTVCIDKTKVTHTDFQGNDVTKKEKQRRIKLLVQMESNSQGVWVAENEMILSHNECTTEAGK